MLRYVTILKIHSKTHVAGIVKIKPAKNVNNPIKPLTNIAVRIKIILEPIILTKCFIEIGTLFKNVANGLVSFAMTAPVKCENSVSCAEWIISDKNDKTARPIIAFKTVSAIKIYEMINKMFTIKNGNENKSDVKPNLIDFQNLTK